MPLSEDGTLSDNSLPRTTWSFEIGPIRPPSEGRDHSLLIRATRNCPWNRCLFCPVYKGQKFQYRQVAEIKEDIDTVKGLEEELKKTSWRLGLGGRINNAVLNDFVLGNSRLYEAHPAESLGFTARLNSLSNVANWLATGGRTVFLQDADTIIMRTPELVDLLRYIKQTFPSVERITSYARARTVARKSLEEMKSLREAGLTRLHVGMESGCDEALQYMNKGVTAAEIITGGQKVVEAGISLSEYIMPGLGGRRWSERHAYESARVLNLVNPDFIRIRSLAVGRALLLHEKVESGDFETLGEDEVVSEIGLFIQHLDCHSYVASDQMVNLLWEVEGQLPQDKQRMLDVISSYLSKSLRERLRFRLERRRRSFFAVYGGLPAEIEEKVECAARALESDAADASQKVDEAIAALKQGFV
jgi:hypothetical protein